MRREAFLLLVLCLGLTLCRADEAETSAEDEKEEKSACDPNPCNNNGTCVLDFNRIDGYECQCKENFKGLNCEELLCSIAIPEKASLICRMKRELMRRSKKKEFKLTDVKTQHKQDTFSAIPRLMIPMLHLDKPSAFIQGASTNPFTIEWYMRMQHNSEKNSDIEQHFKLKDPSFHNSPTLLDYAVIFESFYKYYRKESPMSSLQRLPSVEENFYKDRSFADQRLAGANPSQIKRVISKGVNGVLWSDIFKKLNKNFKWSDAFKNVMNDEETSFQQMLDEGMVYIVHYPELEGIKITPIFLQDIQSNDTALQMTAPIALFVSKETDRGIKRLVPVAIQLDASSDATVFTPDDGKDWFFAKSVVQRADFNVGQLIGKRLKSHIYLDAFCAQLERYYSDYHPVYELMKYHCRATLETNKLFELKLYNPTGPMFQTLTVDYLTALGITNNVYEKMNFADISLNADLESRGVNDEKKLPYYPYRDDGKTLSAFINRFVTAYVDMYYSEDREVLADHETQEWANSLSVEGKGDEGGKGNVKGFPAKIKDKGTLVDVLHKLLWSITGHHAANTYPIMEYGGFVPNAPFRLYGDSEGREKFSNLMFGNKNKALKQAQLTCNIASIHLDQLLDYSSKLEDEKAQKMVENFHKELKEVSKTINSNNDQRINNGFLPYPYLHPDYVTNSVST